LLRLEFKTPRLGEVLLVAGLAYQCTRLVMGHLRAAARSLPPLLGLTALLVLVVRGGSAAAVVVRRRALPEAAAGRPNVLLITLDTLRADHLSAYGYSRPTPSLDRLGREGVLYERAIAP